MKKLKKITFSLFLSKAKSKLFIIGFTIALITMIYSCSSEDESINKSGATKVAIESEKNKTNDKTESGIPLIVDENLNTFSEQIFVNAESLEVALNKNSYVEFNTQTMQMLNAATSENDLKAVFEMAGIANSTEVINILKSNVIAQQAFIAATPDFYSLSQQKQIELLNNSIGLAKLSYNSKIPIPIFDGLQGSPNCARDFNKDIDRCAGDFGQCAVYAVIGAYAGLIPGLIGAAYCMTSKLTCDKRAKEDYKQCLVEQVFPDGPPPTTGEITLHCDRDSCWTTDSNGKYIERID